MSHLAPSASFYHGKLNSLQAEMNRFTAKIVDMMKQENLYASQGGPIILSQIENEYGNIDSAYGPAAKSYIKWAASMATSLDSGGSLGNINRCNGFYCDQCTPNSNAKPKMWTENWSGWFLSFGGAVPFRPVEDLAFTVARFYQRGGTFQNYYMYHGGTNFGQTTGGPFISTSYDYDAPIDEYDVHKAIKLCKEALIAADPMITTPGPNIESLLCTYLLLQKSMLFSEPSHKLKCWGNEHGMVGGKPAAVYKTGSVCSAFLANIATSDATVTFNGNSYHLPAWSVSILPDCKNVVLNTAKINSAPMISSFTTESLKEEVGSLEGSDSGWSWISEPIGISKADSFPKFGLLEQINATADKSDYLWYSLSIDLEDDASSQTVLHIESLGHALHAFINGKLVGSGTGNSGKAKVNVDIPVPLVAEKNAIDLLSLTVELQNYGAFFDTWGAGITGLVISKGLKNGSTVDLSSQQWTYLCIGRYWPTYVSPNGGCTDSCNYRGAYSSSKCLKNCRKPSQTLYHVPQSWLQPDTNTLVLFEESGGDPTQISFATKQIGSVCSHVSESHPPPVDLWNSDKGRKVWPVLSLECPYPNQVISSIKFAKGAEVIRLYPLCKRSALDQAVVELDYQLTHSEINVKE
ncbi:hypothetical protein JHK87_032955 [Glycine soja]|nr:hypothetical protein JHK87_032955 [Glycine soja]